MISYRNGANAIDQIICSHSLPQAVFIASDILALGALSECQRRGIRVPQDMALCGFDDHELSALQNPPLTTVNVPYYQMGKQAAELVISRLNGCDNESRIIDIGYNIIPRQSI
jgi:LacI family gluconate utilization system Gnt-I transcriptional repressor